MSLERDCNPLRFVRRETIDDHMTAMPPRLGRDDIVHGVDEVMAGVPSYDLTEVLPRADAWGDVDRQGAEPALFEATAIRPFLATATAPGPIDPGPGSPSSGRQQTPPHAAADWDGGL